ncbi:MAG: hypothetical protein V4649_11085 [Bacteroidota bacterium]
MKIRFKTILISALSTLSVFTAVMVISASCNRDKCKAIVCAYGGVCNGGKCTCLLGYEGSNCETISRNKFLGNWQVFEKGTITNAAQYPITIEASAFSSDPITDVVIKNFYNYFRTPIKGSVVGDTLYIPNQQYEGKVLHGVGYIYTSVTYGQYGGITMRYEIIDTATQRVNSFGVNEDINHSRPSEWNK